MFAISWLEKQDFVRDALLTTSAPDSRSILKIQINIFL